MRVHFLPVCLATRHGHEPARLVFVGDRMLAILAQLEAEQDVSGTGGWYLTVGFGPCEADGLLFPTLEAAKLWVREQLGEIVEEESGEPGADLERSDPEKQEVRSLRILVVEDDIVQAHALKESLENLGHEVVDLVATGPEAVRTAGEHRPDLVLMDVRLANGTDGIAAAEEIRNRLGILSIFMTGNADPETRARIKDARFVDLLPKPISSSSVAAALQRAAGLH